MQQSNMSGLTALAALRNLRHSQPATAAKKPAPVQQKLPDHYIVIKAEDSSQRSE